MTYLEIKEKYRTTPDKSIIFKELKEFFQYSNNATLKKMKYKFPEKELQASFLLMIDKLFDTDINNDISNPESHFRSLLSMYITYQLNIRSGIKYNIKKVFISKYKISKDNLHTIPQLFFKAELLSHDPRNLEDRIAIIVDEFLNKNYSPELVEDFYSHFITSEPYETIALKRGSYAMAICRIMKKIHREVKGHLDTILHRDSFI